MCTAGMEAADTAEWLGELGRDLQGPMASCCFFRKATTFWATAGNSKVNSTCWRDGFQVQGGSSPNKLKHINCLPQSHPIPSSGVLSYHLGRLAPH